MNALLRDGEFKIPKKINVDFVKRNSIYKITSNQKLIENYIMWNRMHKLAVIEDIGNAANIFGHTPRDDNFIIDAKNMCIDNGSYSNKISRGNLIAIQYPSLKIYKA